MNDSSFSLLKDAGETEQTDLEFLLLSGLLFRKVSLGFFDLKTLAKDDNPSPKSET